MPIHPVVCLVGMPGSGKSTTGRLLARRLDRRFVDLDREVEIGAASSVREIFDAEGESGFRRREAAALTDLVTAGEPVVVATGGGVVTSAAGRRALRRSCVVWLRTDLAVLVDRVGPTGRGRPLLADDPPARLADLAAQRDELYSDAASIVVDTGDRTPAEVVDSLLGALRGEGLR